MHDFGKLVYLDLHKTGSTYISQLLNKCCKLPLRREKKHGRISFSAYDPESYYFISVRHPVAQYRSLFRYGLDKKGFVQRRLRKAGRLDLYENSSEGFNRWLAFLLDRSNAYLFRENFWITSRWFDVGLMSHRYLMFAFPSPVFTAAKMRWNLGAKSMLSGRPWRGDLPREVAGRSMIDYVVRQENLVDDLRELAFDLKPEFFDQDEAEIFLKKERRVNASKRGKDTELNVEPCLLELLQEREALLYQFYPAQRPQEASCNRSLREKKHD